MDKEVTIYDIARELNFSPATVSRALNDHPAINIKTRTAIHSKAREMGYRSNTFASNLRRMRTNTIGVIVPRLNSIFMSVVLAEMERVANLAGYNLLIAQSLESADRERANVQTMFNSRVDALLVSLAYDTDSMDHFELFRNKKVPLVFFDRVPEQKNMGGITIDNYQAGYDVASHLISAGCRQVAHITASLQRNVYRQRYEGFRGALANHAIPFDESMLIIGDLSFEAGRTAARRIIEMNEKPDGIFIANDLCAVTCMNVLKQSGIAIPGQIAIAGFNNDPVSQVVDPLLTTVHYPAEKLGALAIATVLEKLKKKGAAQPEVSLDYELIIRASSKR